MAIIEKIKGKQRAYVARKNALAYVEHLRKVVGLPVSAAYLFGSMAKGTSHGASDVDVCVVSSYFQDETIDELFYLWQNRRLEDVRNGIQPVGFTDDEFAGDTTLPLVQEIKNTGVRLA